MANTKVKAEQLEAAQTNITSLGTLTSLTVDDITINGSTISDAGELTLDIGGDIVLDAGGGDIILKDDGTHWASLYTNGTNTYLQNMIANGDMYFSVNDSDGGGNVNALIIDGSEAGKATFSSGIVATGALFRAAASGATADASADEGVFENSANAGISILSGASNSGSIYFGDSGTNWDGYIAYSQANRQMTIATAAGGNYIYLDSTGHAGFSTTPTAWSSGYKSIQIGARGFVAAHTGSDLYLGQNAFFDGAWKYEALVAASLTQHSGGQVTHKVAAAGTANNAISWINALHITPSGFVGINDIVPPRRLSITGEDGAYSGQTSGNSRTHLLLENNGGNYIEFLNPKASSAGLFFSNQDSQNNGAIYYENDHMYLQANAQGSQLVLDDTNGYIHVTGSTDVRLTIGSTGTAGTNSANWVRGTSSGLSFNAATTGNFYWEAGGTQRMVMLAAGQFIVGSDTTSHTDETKVILHPQGGQTNTYNMSSTNEWWIMNNLASNSGYTTKIDFRTQNTSRGYIGITGSTVQYYGNSDYRLKENYKYDFDATSLIKAMKPLQFTWKDEPMRGTQTGFLAHELKEVCPYVVEGEKDAMREDDESLIRPQVVDQGKLVAVLTKALQEAITRIEALEAK